MKACVSNKVFEKAASSIYFLIQRPDDQEVICNSVNWIELNRIII